MTRDDLWAQILKERERQDKEHGGPAHDDTLKPHDWLYIISQWLNKAHLEQIQDDPSPLLRERLIQLAALCVAAIESLDRQYYERRK